MLPIVLTRYLVLPAGSPEATAPVARRAAAADHQRAAELLLLSGCDVRAVDAGNATALLYAAGAPLSNPDAITYMALAECQQFWHSGSKQLL
jgi:hypothetical protein